MIHIPIALLIQLLLVLAGLDVFAAAAAATLFFVGREIAQAEYRWIEHYGHGLRANMRWYKALSKDAWTRKSVLDVLLPAAATAGAALAAQHYNWVALGT